MNVDKKFPRWVTIAVLTLLLIQVWAISGLTSTSNLPRFPAVEAQTSTITGTISAVESGTTGTSNWSIGSNTNPNGTTIKVDIRIDGATPLTIWGWTMNVNWSPSILQLEKLTQGNFLSDGGSTLMVGNTPSLWNNTGGYIMGGLGCVDSSSGSPQTTDTSGILATLSFLVIGYGTAKITLTNDDLLAVSSQRTGTSVSVQDATITVNKPSSAIYHVNFNETGLASGTKWSVTFNGGSASSTGPAVSFSVSPGSYSYSIGEVSGYAASPQNGTITVSDANESVQVTFTLSYLSAVTKVQAPASITAGESLTIEITINNLSNSSPWAELDVTVFDHAQIPIASYTTTNTKPTQDQTVTATINIPDWAFPGQAAAYVCLLSANGTAMAPENVANFQVLPITTSKVTSAFVTAEYAWGGLIALLAAFAAFAAFRMVKKGHPPSS